MKLPLFFPFFLIGMLTSATFLAAKCSGKPKKEPHKKEYVLPKQQA